MLRRSPKSLLSRAKCFSTSTSTSPNPYRRLKENFERVRTLLPGRALSVSEKILLSHLHDPDQSLGSGTYVRGESYLRLVPDRVAMQDASAQMALLSDALYIFHGIFNHPFRLQFMSTGLDRCAVPSSIHCDHLIQASTGADADLQKALVTNKEVFSFLESAARKYGIDFWPPGSGIIHQIVLENYASPGTILLGTDSHTPNAGGLGLLAVGVGGADAVDALTGTPWELLAPIVCGIKLTGQLSGWTTPKDVILHLAGRLGVKGGTGKILEYFGPGVSRLSCTGMATICNNGAEIGATTSIFPYTPAMERYLQATQRSGVASDANEMASMGFFVPDERFEYDEMVEINLSELEPHINGPFTPDLSTPISKFAQEVRQNGWTEDISACLIGSCTNSSYEDMDNVTALARQVQEAGMKSKVPFLVTPGSEQIRATMERDDMTTSLETVGATVLANACGPCIGQWDRGVKNQGENAIVTSFNRNFKGRNDGNNSTLNFLASPTIVFAMAMSGKLTFNPLVDTIGDFKFSPPSGKELPEGGFTLGRQDLYPPKSAEPQPDVEVVIDPESQRLEALQPFPSHFKELSAGGLEFPPLKVLLRVGGKCTTDTISAAGPWLRYKGHLTNISENTLITAINDETGEMNVAYDPHHSANEPDHDTIPNMAKRLRARRDPWALVVGENYGEGSAREHAALQPRFYGCKLIVAQSFARIHETNLKKQGILPLWFTSKEDYKRIGAGDIIETKGLSPLLEKEDPNAKIALQVTKVDGSKFEIPTSHTLSKGQIKWLRAGSALNAIRNG